MADQTIDYGSANTLRTLGRSWGWLLFFGLLNLAIGILVMAYPRVTLGIIAFLFALQLFLVGLYRFVTAFAGDEKHRVLSAIIGALAIIAAIICLRNIAQTVVILTLILGIYWVVYGVLDLVMALGDRSFPNRGLTIVVGILAIIAGIFVLSYPVNSAVTLAYVLGIWFVVLGVLGVIGAFMVRREGKDLPAAPGAASGMV